MVSSNNEEAAEFEPLPTYLELAMAAATAHETPKARQRKGFFLWRLSPIEKTIALAIAGLAFYGLALIGDGFLLKAKAEISQVLLKRAFAAELSGKETKPWPWADFTTEAKVRAPRLGQEAIVLSGASGEALAFGPAWLANTPQPGEEGTSVIAAHRDTHFRWLQHVRPGDAIEITRRDGKLLTFKAGEGRIAPWDASGIDASSDGRRLVLTTCWPFDTTERGPLRYILEAELVDGEATGSVQSPNTKPLLQGE
ncbi:MULTISPECIES: class GN sortase [Rhizobium]|uniref:class GN sortase n=1 Tax=Rhizobium TaxID=379 RepID=UPI001105D395|nr:MULTISPECIES: class GN sortase [Rhizobium]MBX4883406.1 class GN sortase [Rhizobium bangladeshense]MBX4888430.1 class GN sortase [Rhizobium bangladeshense]MBX4894340.1 class GN sortase [Rhizobium bangladeshense]MBX4900293.1 class GN sortase [Rhizobium bangladeshense]MBX4912494.1 class GN sortase [Rhizobium bangladeshense]